MKAFNKFAQWLLGKSDITVHTNHQPLQSIFQNDLAAAPPDDGILTTPQFQSYLQTRFTPYILMTLSSAPLQEHNAHSDSTDTFQNFRTNVAQGDPTSPTLTESTHDRLHKTTAPCLDIQLLEHHIIQVWPPTKQGVSTPLQPFRNFKDEFSVADGFLLNSSRVIVPHLCEQTCYTKSMNPTEVTSTAYILPEMQSSGLTCPRTLKFFVILALPALGMESNLLPNLSYPIPT